MTNEPGVIHLTQFIPHPPARVWTALTDPQLLAKWWAAGDVRPLAGHRFTLDMGQWGKQACEVTAVEPGKSFSYAFAVGTLNTTISWNLEPEGGGTRLSLKHAGFDLDSPMGKTAFQGMSAGWPMVLARMDAALSAG